LTPLQTREVVVHGCGGWIQDSKESLIPGMLATTREIEVKQWDWGGRTTIRSSRGRLILEVQSLVVEVCLSLLSSHPFLPSLACSHS
jgi:hypothetical protein